MFLTNRLLMFLALSFSLGCGGAAAKRPPPSSGEDQESAPTPPANTSADTGNCLIRMAGHCFDTFESACEALQCPPSRCVKQSYPAEVRCSDHNVLGTSIPEQAGEPVAPGK
jgi:hypothetical protein